MIRRRRQASRKLQLEILEPRQLLSLASDRPLLAAAARHAQTRAELSNMARADLDVFATQLVHHPLMAERQGLGALATMMDQHAGYAARHGWGATFDLVLSQHPAYAARHDLTALMATPSATTSTMTTLATPTAAATDPASTTTTSSPAVTDPVSTTSSGSSPVAPPITSPSPVSVAAQSFSVAVGGVLDATVQPGLASGTGVAYTITPQPLPANMTFNRETGALAFAAAPGQAGTYPFTITATNGSRAFVEPVTITVTQPQLAATEVSGQVVDESGNPLAGMPVAIGTATATTDAQGDFTLTGIGANPSPLSAGGAVATAEGRLALSAPVAQLLGHAPYAGADNVIATPLIVPKVDWSAPSSFTRPVATQPLTATNAAFPGFAIELAAGSAGRTAATGTLQVAELSAAESAQHMPAGESSPMLLYKTVGLDLTEPAQLTLPNISGYAPGAVVSLLKFNPRTGGHDSVAQMVVSADGKTMTSTGTITLAAAPASGASPAVQRSDNGGGSLGGGSGLSGGAAGASPALSPGGTGGSSSGGGADYSFSGCLLDEDGAAAGNPDTECAGCQSTVDGTATAGGIDNVDNPGSNLTGPQFAMASNAGLVTGEYFQDHQLVTYQSQGQELGIDLQYSSGHADPEPIVQYQFTTPDAGNSSSISSITAQLTVAGVVQGDPTTYDIPSGGLANGETYNIPLQVNASELATGVYPYTMTVTEDFGTGMGMTAITSSNEGYVNVVNSASDAMGAGWSVGGLQQLSQVSSGGPVLVTAGQQGTEQFVPVYNDGQTDLQDLALASSTSSAQIMANDGAGGFTAANVSSPGMVVGTASGDFTGNGRVDMAVVSSSTLAILLNNGSGGFTAGDTYSLPSGEEAKAIAVGNFTGHTDGTLDIAVLLAPSDLSGDYSVAIYAGNGDGTFASPVVTSAGNGVSSGSTPDTMTVADFNGDGLDDLAFTTDDGLADVMLATSDGSFSSATALSLPSGHSAIGITAVDYNDDGVPDLVVEAANANVNEGGAPFVALDLFTGTGSASFDYVSTEQTVGQPDPATLGLVTGAFDGPDTGLEVAVPISDGGGGVVYIDIVPLSTSGTWGNGVIRNVATMDWYSTTQPGNIVAADLNGTGKPSIALSDGDMGEVVVLLADPASNQMLPVEHVSATNLTGMLAVAPFDQQTATAGYRGPTSDPSTLVRNEAGTWTRTYPDGTVIQFNSSGQETSEADSNGNTTSYAYVTSGAAAGALYTITDPVGLVTTLAYDSSGHLSTITDPADRVTTFTVDSNDNLTSITDPDDAVTQYGYSTPSNHEMTSETDPNDNTATVTYNSFGQFTSETLFDGTSSTEADPSQSNGLYAPGGEGALSTSLAGTVTDTNGNTTTLTFNWMSHPTGEADATGASTSTTYSRQGFPATETDAMGRTTTYTYDNEGDVTSITQFDNGAGGSGSNETETITYGVDEVPTSITDFNGQTTTYTLDSHGNILTMTDPDGYTTTYTYNSAGQVLTDTDPNGGTTTYTYDDYGRLDTVTDPLGHTTTYGYDGAGDLTSVTDPDGNTTTYTYDAAGRVLTIQDPIAAAAGKETSYTYDADGNETSMTDANGNTTTYSYNARNELVGMTDPANQGTGRQYAYTYDADGNLQTATDPLGNTTTYSYDGDNRLASVTDALNNQTAYVYDGDGELIYLTDGNYKTTTYSYDSLGQLQTESQHNGSDGGTNTTTYTYDPDGNQTSVTDGDGDTTTYTYDPADRLIAVTDGNDHTTTYTYDGDGNETTVTDPIGDVTTYTYDADDRQVSETDPSGGGTTTYTYDPAGNLLTVTDPDDNTTTYSYDADNRETTETSPTGGVTTYTYDLVGNLIETVDPDGHTITYSYDADNRETGETWVNPEGGTPLDVFTTTYDADGNVTSIGDDNSSYSYTYDADNHLESDTADYTVAPDVPEVSLTYTYDGVGNITSLSDSLGGAITYYYNDQNQVTDVWQSGSDEDTASIDFTYDHAGNMTGQTDNSDAYGEDEVLATSYTYDNANNLVGISDQLPDSTVVASYSYTLDAADRLTQETRTWADGSSSDTTDYTYTDNNQLTGVTHSNSSFANESFSYDANGNRTMTGYSTATGNELTSDGTYDYTYDADGNRITQTDIATGDETIYTYDFRNRLVEVQQVVGGVESVLAQYTYDALNRRIGVSEGGATTWTLYNGTSTDALIDFDNSGDVTARYLYGPSPAGVDAVLARDTPSGGIAWYLADRLGSVGDIVNNSGTVIDHIDYTAFGTPTQSNPSEGDRFEFAGLEYDEATGLNLAVYRVEDPSTERWLSQDPTAFAGGDANLYRYTNNDPINASDFLGLGFWEAWEGLKAVGPWDAWNASDWGWMGSAAISFANRLAPNSGNCSIRNAAHHAYWQAIMTVRLGEHEATQIGFIHEFNGWNETDSIIDLYNNEIGRAIGSTINYNQSWSNIMLDIEKKVKAAILDGSLITCDDDSRISDNRERFLKIMESHLFEIRASGAASY